MSLESVFANPPNLVGVAKEMETEDKESDYDRGPKGEGADMEDGELPEDGEIVDQEEERRSRRKESRHHEHRDRDNGFEEGEGSESDEELSKRARKRRRHRKNRNEGSGDDSKKSKKKKRDKKEQKKYVDHDRVEEEGENTPGWSREQSSHGHHHHQQDNNKHHHDSKHHHDNKHHHEHPREHKKFEEEDYADSPGAYGSPYNNNQDRTPEYEYDDYDDFDDMEPPHKKTMMSFVDDGFVDPSMGMGDRQELFEHHHRGRGRGPGRGGQMMRGGRGRGRGRGDRGRGRGGQDRGRGGHDRGRGGRDRGRGGRGRGGMPPHGPPHHPHQHDHGNQRGPPPRRDEMKQNRPLCKFFKEGYCHKGDGCVFSHDCTPNHKMEVCKFYISGQCRKGDNCSYLHGQYPCKYYHTGAKCFQGNNCKFSHEALDERGKLLLEKILREQSEREMERDFNRDRPHHHEDRGRIISEMIDNQQFGGSPPHMYEGDSKDGGIPSLLDIKTNPPSPEKHGPPGPHGPAGLRGPRPRGPPPVGMHRPQGFYKDTLAPPRHPGPLGPSLRPPLLPDPIPRGMPPPHMRMPGPPPPLPPPPPSAANVVSAMAEAIASAIRTHQKEALKAKEEKQDEPKPVETIPKPSDLIKKATEPLPDFVEALPKPAESESLPKPADLPELPESVELLKTASSPPTLSDPTPAVEDKKDVEPKQSAPAAEVKMEPIEIMSPTRPSTVTDSASTENADDQSSGDQKPSEADVKQEPMETNDGKVEAKTDVVVETEAMETSEVKVEEEPKGEADENVPASQQNSEAKPEQAVETKPQTSFPEIPENLPPVQRQLLLRLQQAQKEPEPPQENPVSDEKEIEDDNWYSSDEEDELPSKKSLSDIMKNITSTQAEPPKAASPPLVKPSTSVASTVPSQPMMDIGSMLSMIRQQTTAAANTVAATVAAPPASVAAPVVTSTATVPPVRRDPRLLGAPAPRIDPRTQQPPPTSSATLVVPPEHPSASPRHNEPTPEIYGIISNPKPFRLVPFTMEPNNRPCLPPGLNITDPRYREDPRCAHYKNTVVKRNNNYQTSLSHSSSSPGHLRPPANLHRRDSSSSDSGTDTRLKTQNSAPGALGVRDPRMLQQARSMDPRSSGGSSPAAHWTGGDPRAPPTLSQARPLDPRGGGGSSPAAHRTGGDPRAAPMPKLLAKDPRSDLQIPNTLQGFELPPLGSSSDHQFAMPKLLLERPEPLKGKPELQSTPQSPLPVPALNTLPPLLAQPPPLLLQPPPGKAINLETGSPQNSPPAQVQKLSPAHQESPEISSPPNSDRTKSLSHRADPRFKRRPSVKNPEPEPVPVVNEDKTEQRRQNVEYSSPLSGQSNRQEDSYSSYNRRPNNYEKSGRKGGKSDPRQSSGGQDPRQRRDPRFPGGSGDPRGHSDPRKQLDNDQQIGDPQHGEPSFLHPGGGDPRFSEGAGDPRFQQTGGIDPQGLPGCNPIVDSLHGAGGMNIDLTDPRFQQITGLPPEVFAQMQQQQNEQSLRDVFKTFDPTASPFC